MMKNYESQKRFWSKVTLSADGCLLWNGCKIRGGYGLVSISGRRWLAHRIAYIWQKGSIPEGLELDHLCRVRNCVNPNHLRPVTRRQNIMAEGSLALTKVHAMKTYCPRGHSYSGENLYIFPGHYRRRCNECRRLRANAKNRIRREQAQVNA